MGIKDNVHDLNEFRSAAGIITAFRNWLVDLQLDEQKGCIEVEDGDNNEQLGLSAHLEYLECLLAVIDVHLGRASLAGKHLVMDWLCDPLQRTIRNHCWAVLLTDVWEQHFEDNSTVTETMDPAILSRFRLCAAQVVDNLSPVGVSFDSVLVELLGNLSNLVYQRTSDLFDDFASDAENLTALIAASITLRDCMDCKASRVRFEPHVHMEGFHADFELWELLQHLIDRIRKTTDAGEPFRSYCQVRFNYGVRSLFLLPFLFFSFLFFWSVFILPFRYVVANLTTYLLGESESCQPVGRRRYTSRTGLIARIEGSLRGKTSSGKLESYCKDGITTTNGCT